MWVGREGLSEDDVSRSEGVTGRLREKKSKLEEQPVRRPQVEVCLAF